MTAFFVARLITLTILFSAPAFAIDIEVRGVQQKVLFQTTVDPKPLETIGTLTDRILSEALKQGQILQYNGSSSGLTSVNHLGSKLEVISNSDLNAYGWCYLIDGVESGKLASQYVLTGREMKLEWFYAYAIFQKDRWTAMCVPAN